jgi:hypothetical protein
MTHVLGSINLDGTLASRHYGESHGDKENLDREGAVLMACRSTKRGNELRKVVPPKIIQ